MTATIPEITPSEIILGDTLTFKIYVPDYLPSDSWVMSYAFVKTGTRITITGSDNGDGFHLITASAATTAAYTAGDYKWQSYVTKAAERFAVSSGTTKLVSNFATQSSGLDTRSHVKKTLDALEAMIEGKASSDQMAYTINGRSITRMSPDDLIKWRSHYKYEYKVELEAEKLAQGLSTSNKIRIRF